jgi:integrating conjugative element protein (TIGR03755 family)
MRWKMKLKTHFFLLFMPSMALAGLIPNAANDLYYKLGGGQNVPMPAYMSTDTVSLSVEGNIGAGYNCGLFDQQLSITNSLNSLKNSFQNIQQNIINNARAAIAEIPMYAISRADPSLYNLLNNGLLSARKDFGISTKDCQFMQSEIGQGKNPYQDWATLSMGNDWKYHMGLSKTVAGRYGAASSDINDVKSQVQKDNGENGVPWVKGSQTRGDRYAGGKNQPPIAIIHDTAIAGYNVVLQPARAYTDTSAPAKTDANARLVETWANPTIAASWISGVVGEQLITTYSGGEKKSSPGIGLLPDTQALTKKLTDAMTGLVVGNQLTLKSLQDVSAPRVAINAAVINTIRQQPAVMRAIFISKLAQEVAAARVIDKAQLALQILEEGGQVPVIYGNDAAQKTIAQAMIRLRNDIEDLLFNVKVNKELVSTTVAELFQATKAEQIAGASIPAASHGVPLLQDGAIMQEDK